MKLLTISVLLLLIGIVLSETGFRSFKKEKNNDAKSNSGTQRKRGQSAEKDETSESVVVLTSESFDKVALDPTKDVFVEFYAVWCGHCKALTPIWSQLAEVYKATPNVVIAKIDGERNREIASRYGIVGFPTMMFFSKSNKQGELYRGYRTNSDLFVDWLKQRVGSPVPAIPGVKYETVTESTISKGTQVRQQLEQIKEKSEFNKNKKAEEALPPTPVEKTHEVTPKREESEEIESTDEGNLEGHNGVKLFYQVWSVGQPKVVLVLLHGLGDHSGRYKHLVNHLVPEGFSIYGFDLRGSGRSQGQKGDIEDWNDYREDLRIFLKFVKKDSNVKKVVLIGHDLGGLIALDYAIRYKAGVQGVVALSPILSQPRINFTDSAGIIRGVFEKDWSSESLEFVTNFAALTKDTDSLVSLRNDPLLHSKISNRLKNEITVTYEWVLQHAEDMKVPILLTHGTGDQIVSGTAIERFFLDVDIEDKDFKTYKGALHRTFDDAEREDVLNDIAEWILDHE